MRILKFPSAVYTAVLSSILFFPSLSFAQLVAIIDTGVDPEQKVLSRYLWENPGETGIDSLGRDKATNGIDDDQNGYVDDVHGWDFLKNSPQISDHHGHGTHVAGLVVAGTAITDPLPSDKVKVMILKYYDNGGSAMQTMTASEKALAYAIQMGAQIINFSGGGATPSLREKALLKEAEKRNILVVAAAGNDGVNVDRVPFFPASYELSNILSVTGANTHDRLLKTSNYGEHTHISAPGESILSFFPGGNLVALSGTSQATALVTHEILKTWQDRMDLRTPQKMIEQIQKTGVFEISLLKHTKNATRLNSAALRSQRDQGIDYKDERLNWKKIKTYGLYQTD